MTKIDIRGVSHFYELTASNSQSPLPVLVFIHGWLLSHNYWYPLVEKLTPYYRCLIYDLRGFGESQILANNSENQQNFSQNSPPIQGNYSLANYTEDLKILLEKLDIQEAWLIGHSLGGSIAIWGADMCQDKIKGVICLNAGGGIYLKEEFERFRQAGQNLVKFRQNWFISIPFFDCLFARMMVARPLALKWGHQRLIDFLKANQEAAIGSLLDSTTEEEVHLLPQIVSRLSPPVYFLGGNQDTVMEVKYVKHLASFHHLFASNAVNVFEIDDCGHFAMLEQTNLVSEKILEIIKKD